MELKDSNIFWSHLLKKKALAVNCDFLIVLSLEHCFKNALLVEALYVVCL